MNTASGSEMFEDLTKRIKNVASKMDVLLFGSRKVDKELTTDVVTLQCFHIAVFRQPSAVLDGYLKRLQDPKPTEAEKKAKKESGSYFTPPFIADYIVRSTIGPMTDKLLKGRKPTRPKTKIKNILRLRICDQAVGGGIFLVSAHDHLMKAILEIDPNADLDEMSRRTAKCLFGVDINPGAVEGCRLMLNLNIAKWSLKESIDAFANSALANSFLPNASSDKSENQSSAQGPAQDEISTQETTQPSAKKRNARRAARSSELQTGIVANDSAQPSAQQEVGSRTRRRISKPKEKNLGG